MSNLTIEDLITELSSAVEFDEFDTDDIISVLKHADDVYANTGDEVLSDAAYDRIYMYARAAAPKNPYFQEVGSDVRGGKVALPNPMGSLTQVYTEQEFEQYKTKHGIKPTDIFIVMEKLDGASNSPYFDSAGWLRISFSRGNGFQGADNTRHLKYLLPGANALRTNLNMRVEVIISKANFDIAKTKFFRSDGKPYKNPRNMVSGLLNSSEADPEVYKYMDVIAFHDWDEPEGLDKAALLESFADAGFLIPRYKLVTADQLTDSVLTKILNDFRDTSSYEIDGVVVEANDYALRNRMNPSKTTLNPEYARKYKVADASNFATPVVKGVEWRISKRGYLKPRVHFVPFELCGVTIKHATGFNADFIVRNRIAAGAMVTMTRSGDVIPFITGVVAPSALSVEEIEDQITDVAPWKWSENHVDAILTEGHELVGRRLAEAFFTAIEVKKLKEANIRNLFDVGYDTPAKIIQASAEEIAFAIGSDSVAQEIHKSIHEQLKKFNLPQFMGATGLFGRGIGKRKMQALHDMIGDEILRFDDPSVYSKNLDGFDTKSKNKIINGIPAYRAFFDEVSAFVEFPAPRQGGKLSGQVFLFTGFRNSVLKEQLIELGADVADSFSSKVTCVIAADPGESTGKVQKARQKGTKIIGLTDVDELFQ